MNWELPVGVKSRTIKTERASVHYLECGEVGKPVWVLFHPMPLSSFMWRHVMSHLGQSFHVYAPDLVGCGYSEVEDYNAFGLLEQMQVMREWLQLVVPEGDVSLLGHGWGALMVHGLVSEFSRRVKCVGFYEAYLRPITKVSDMGLPVMQLHDQIQNHPLGNPDPNYNFMLDEFLPLIEEGRVAPDVAKVYRQPFSAVANQHVLRRFLSELMDINSGSLVNHVIGRALPFYQDAALMKVVLYSMPGLLNSVLSLDEFRSQNPHVHIRDVGEGFFLAPEFSPKRFANALHDCVAESQSF